MSAPPVGRLHVITDESLQRRFSHQELAILAARGGADVVQFREKRPRTTRELLGVAVSLRHTLDAYDVRLVINDRVDLALACGAAAVHLGRKDMDPLTARLVLGDEALIGATANDEEEALRMARLPVDYLGVGPVFGTSSKANPAPALELNGLRRIVSVQDKPVIAIGGIEAANAADVLGAGAHGIAVLSGVVCRADPEVETRRLREIVRTACENHHGER
jgi:thiamine-phosphate pyrophosphorylase